MNVEHVNRKGETLSLTTQRVQEKFSRVTEVGAIHEGQSQNENSQTLSDALERFRLWAGSVGAAVDANRKISLEWRLREAPEIKDRVSDLLSDLIEALDDLYAIFTGAKENRTRDAAILEPDNRSDSGEEQLEINAVDETQDILAVVKNCIRSLLQLSMLIRKATPRDRWMRALQKSNIDRLDDQFDIRHVGEKYPKLQRPENEWLKIRLGRAITQRRQFIRYCREHRSQMEDSRLENMISLAPVSAEPEIHTSPEVPRSIVESKALTLYAPITERSTKASTLHVRTLEAIQSGIDEEDLSEVSSVVSSIDLTDDNEGLLQLPSLHELNQGQYEFECPLCYTLQSFHSQRKWKKHAFSDLKPYVCSAGRGECDLELFGDRKVWFSHELEKHRHQWTCFICSKGPFTSQTHFFAHIRSQHGDISQKLDDIGELCKQPLTFISAADCPFCDEFDVRLRAAQPASNTSLDSALTSDPLLVPILTYRRHVASHMEQLALFALGTYHGPGKSKDTESTTSDHGQNAEIDDLMNSYLADQDEFEPHSADLFIREGIDQDQHDWSNVYGDFANMSPEDKERVRGVHAILNPEEPESSDEKMLSGHRKQIKNSIGEGESDPAIHEAMDELVAQNTGTPIPLSQQGEPETSFWDENSTTLPPVLQQFLDLQCPMLTQSGRRINLHLDDSERQLFHYGGPFIMTELSNNDQDALNVYLLLYDHYLIIVNQNTNVMDYRFQIDPVPIDLLAPHKPLLDYQVDKSHSKAFFFTCLGRDTYTLRTSIRIGLKWMAKFIEVKAYSRRSFFVPGPEPFDLRVIANSSFAASRLVKLKERSFEQFAVVPGSQLASALDSEKGHEEDQVSREPAKCAMAYKVSEGPRMIAIGTDKGVYISTVGRERKFSLALDIRLVTQLTMLQPLAVPLVLTDGCLCAYPSSAFVRPESTKSPRPLRLTPKEKRTTIMVPCTVGDRTLVAFNATSSITPYSRYSNTRFKLLEPINTSVSGKTRFIRLLNIRSPDEDYSAQFRDFDEFTISADCHNLNVFTRSVAAITSKDFKVLTLDNKLPWSVPDFGSSEVPETILASIQTRLYADFPDTMLRLPWDEFICCYRHCAVYVNKYGGISRPDVVEYLSRAQKVVGHESYLLIFHNDFLEIRNAHDGGLRQIIEGQDMKCLDGALMPGDTVKIAMRNPRVSGKQLLLELVLSETDSLLPDPAIRGTPTVFA